MKKNLVAAMLGIMMSFALVGCGKTVESTTATETETEVVTEVEEVIEEPTELVEETEEPVEVEETEEPTEVVEETEESTQTVVEEYTYTDLSQTMYAQSTVNVRDLPEQSGGKVGSRCSSKPAYAGQLPLPILWCGISFI